MEKILKEIFTFPNTFYILKTSGVERVVLSEKNKHEFSIDVSDGKPFLLYGYYFCYPDKDIAEKAYKEGHIG